MADAVVGGADTPRVAAGGAAGAGGACAGRAGRDDPERQALHVRAGSHAVLRGGNGVPGGIAAKWGLLLPGAPRTALIAYAATASASVLSLALVIWPDNGGTMPSERYVFTARVEPRRPHVRRFLLDGGGAGHCPRVHYAYSTDRLSP